ncbi:hypothetical protein [Actinomadura sp. 9N215]
MITNATISHRGECEPWPRRPARARCDRLDIVVESLSADAGPACFVL